MCARLNKRAHIKGAVLPRLFNWVLIAFRRVNCSQLLRENMLCVLHKRAIVLRSLRQNDPRVLMPKSGIYAPKYSRNYLQQNRAFRDIQQNTIGF